MHAEGNLLAKRACEKLCGFFDAAVETKMLRLERALARQRQQPAVQAAEALILENKKTSPSGIWAVSLNT